MRLTRRDVDPVVSIDCVVWSGKRLDADEVFAGLGPELEMAHFG